jgi:chaperonin GroEL
MSKLSRKLTFGEEFEAKRSNGVYEAYKLARACYGPTSGSASIELNYGYPIISRDGVTNLRKLYLEDGDENMAARTLVQASEKNNKLVGDGTTGVVILAYHLYQEAMKLIGAGFNQMVVSRQLKEVANEVIQKIDEMKIDTTPKLSRFVAKVAANDEAIGDMIASVIDKIGLDGNIIVEEFDGIGSYDEEVEGFYFRKGFTNEFLVNNLTALESRMNDVDIFITEKSMKTAADIGPILNKIIHQAGKGTEVLIVGEVTDEALATLALNKVNQNIYPTLVDVPVFGPLRSLFLEDIAISTGGTVFPSGANSSSFTTQMLGEADKVIINTYSTTIIGGKGAKEDLDSRIANLREQLEKSESLTDKEEIKKRLSALTGKIAIVHVGAPTEIDRGETQLRVEDAIAATQSAIRDGIVPGGGVCLARIAPKTFKKAFTAPFEVLVDNAGLNSQQALFKALEGDNVWFGYDLKNPNEDYKPIDLLKEGIIDPAEVIKEVVRNSVSVVSTLITTKVGITFMDRENKAD